MHGPSRATAPGGPRPHSGNVVPARSSTPSGGRAFKETCLVDHPEITGLSLFSGIGGLDLGIECAFQRLGYRWRPVAYVEREAYCVNTLLARIESGDLPAAPIWTDATTFDGRRFRGLVDCLIGGPPCQAFSEASRGRRRQDRDLWELLLDTVHSSRPTYVFAENVDSKSSRQRLQGVHRSLCRMGYRVMPYLRTSASEVEAPHDRRRVWLLAHAYSKGQPPFAINAKMARVCRIPRQPGPWIHGKGLGVDDGVSHRVDRLRALGNAVVPAQAEKAFLELLQPQPPLDRPTDERGEDARQPDHDAA